MNEELLAEFTTEKVVVALKQKEPLKALGPDGLPLLFFQHYWQAVKDDVIEVVLSCLSTGVIPPSINRTFITLKALQKSLNFAIFPYITLSISLFDSLSQIG